MSTVVVTGALGNVGSAVVEHLQRLDVPVRAADIDVDALANRFGDGVEIAHLDLTDDTTFAAAASGAQRAFLIRPPAISKVGPTLNRFIDVAVDAGVDHIVFSSVAGADTNSIVPHHKVEQHLMASDVAWTMLRPGFFAQNIGSAYRRDIVERDEIYVPAGDGLVSFIDARDIGEAAAVTLADDSHRMEAHHITGTRAVHFDEVARIVGEAVGRDISYRKASILGYFVHLKRQGLAFPHALVQTILHTGLRRGDGEPVTDELEHLLGRPPRTLEEYVADNAHLWSTDGSVR